MTITMLLYIHSLCWGTDIAGLRSITKLGQHSGSVPGWACPASNQEGVENVQAYGTLASVTVTLATKFTAAVVLHKLQKRVCIILRNAAVIHISSLQCQGQDMIVSCMQSNAEDCLVQLGAMPSLALGILHSQTNHAAGLHRDTQNNSQTTLLDQLCLQQAEPDSFDSSTKLLRTC